MTCRQSPDEQLVQSARRGDREAQQELWRAHRRWVAAIILAHRPRTVEVEDLLQDVAVKFVSKIHTLRDDRAFRPWLRQIALNVCRGAARSTKSLLRFAGPYRDDTDKVDPGSISEPVSPDHDAPHQLAQLDAAQRLLEQALSLPMTYREPLLLRCVRALSYQQISEVLDLPITTVETRLARARRMLREEVGEEFPEDSKSKREQDQ
ncbi:MAG: RNA polymerase sigma factor [Planctomycetes bacterium]|nr:RNA polymerase sigma factor [Planctomycetota bacterium]